MCIFSLPLESDQPFFQSAQEVVPSDLHFSGSGARSGIPFRRSDADKPIYSATSKLPLRAFASASSLKLH
jgi:hypothetical protein